MSLTTDPDDPDLGHGSDDHQVPQNKKYLVLSEEELAKGFVRPLRTGYIHVGAIGPEADLRPLTQEEHEKYDQLKYIAYEEYGPDHPQRPKGSSVIGRYWTQAQLAATGNGCGALTKMAYPLAATYARDPHFYGSTYCCSCMKHLPVSDFVWEDTTERVGS